MNINLEHDTISHRSFYNTWRPRVASNFENIDIDVNIGIFFFFDRIRKERKRDKKKRETGKLGEREKFKDNRIIGEDEWGVKRDKKNGQK